MSLSLFTLQALSLSHFRNIEALSVNFCSGINLFVGDNAQGKTNILEAIALACSLRSMQSLSNSDLIQTLHAQAFISADFFDHQITIQISPQGKKAKALGKIISSAQQRAQNIPLVSFIPQELAMLTGSASLRRRALDQAALALHFEHYRVHKAYEKILSHRNRLLKAWPLDNQSILSFTKLMIEEGSLIIYYRLETLYALENYFSEYICDILGLAYKSQLNYINNNIIMSRYSLSDIKASLTAQAEKMRPYELMRKVSLFGPHLDDLEFNINSQSAKTHASRGQMRALVLAFKLAVIRAVYDLRNNKTVIVLDDIISELDNHKKTNLIKLINNLNIQSFFSATNSDFFESSFAACKTFRVHNGSIIT